MKKLLVKLIIIFLSLVLIGIAILAGLGYLEAQDKLNDKPLEEVVSELRSSTNYTPLDAMSPYLKDGVVAIEDKRFYSHGGLDYKGIIRGIVVTASGDGVQGGSSITQQLAKQLYYKDNNGGLRKIAEAFIAKKLEKNYTKDEILEMYININYYGDGHEGIYNASMGYFNCLPIDLSLAQASMLAGMPQAPSVYALSNKDKRSYERQKQVLKSMLDQEKITQDEYSNALVEIIE